MKKYNLYFEISKSIPLVRKLICISGNVFDNVRYTKVN